MRGYWRSARRNRRDKAKDHPSLILVWCTPQAHFPGGHVIVGLLAHVDAGKTTLAEALLYDAGRTRRLGRVDHGDSALDTNEMERERGITIFAAQAELEHTGRSVTIVDAPGHVDFSAEAERVLSAVDCTVLVVGANDGVQGHTETLWRLLARRAIPTFVFANKMDLLPDGDTPQTRAEVLASLRAHLAADGGELIDADGLMHGDSTYANAAREAAAATDETALDEYLETGVLAPATLARLVGERRVFPVLFGSALKSQSVTELLDTLVGLGPQPSWPAAFAARVYRVSHEGGERLCWLKVTGGTLRAKQQLEGIDAGKVWAEKANQLRVYTGERFELASEVAAGRTCAVTGLSHVRPGDVLGAEPAGEPPMLAPVLAYGVEPGEGADNHAVLLALRELAEEDPMLGVAWDERVQQVRLQLMGAVQLEVVRELLQRRYGLAVSFGPGRILYKETIDAPQMGIGHFEPLRHYAEAHLLLEPGKRGSGVVFGTRCSEDELDRNWQRLILTNAMERDHLGTLTGAPLTDVRITLCAGRAHTKHTEGGDFRQATYRAVRQALMCAREQGHCVLLEPWYHFELAIPANKIGRALADLTRMHARFGSPDATGETATVAGELPASELGDYAIDVAAYTSGRGSLTLELAGYEPCHDAEKVIEQMAYEPEADLPNTPDSVFCSHGAGYTVKWNEVPAHAHVKDDPTLLRPWREADASFFAG